MPKPNFALIEEVLRHPELVLNAPFVKQGWEIRPERDTALQYVVRVLAEMKARGILAENFGLDESVDEFRANLLGPSKDYLAGSTTVAEIGNEALRALGEAASARERYAAYLMKALDASEPFAFSAFLAKPSR